MVTCCYVWFFFFQEKEGIGISGLSGGLGDVFKGQFLPGVPRPNLAIALGMVLRLCQLFKVDYIPFKILFFFRLDFIKRSITFRP